MKPGLSGGAAVGGGAALAQALRHSITLTELQQLQLQYRLVAALLAGALIFDMLDPAMLLLAGTHSLILDAASATQLGPIGIGIVFVVLALLIGPYLALQCGCWPDRCRGITQFTCLVLALSALVWFFLAWRCVHLDVGAAVPLLLARNGAGALMFSLVLAFSLNAELLRTRLERPE